MQPNRRKIAGAVSSQTFAFLEQMIASQKVANVGEAVDLAVEAMRREDHRKRKERSASYAEEPSLEAVAEDHATIRAMRNSNPDLLFGE